jgi:hypothetical protein
MFLALCDQHGSRFRLHRLAGLGWHRLVQLRSIRRIEGFLTGKLFDIRRAGAERRAVRRFD